MANGAIEAQPARMRRSTGPRSLQTGAGTVEISLALLILVFIVVALIDASRWLHAWSAAGEATRLGSRLASICDRSAESQSAIRMQMRPWLTELTLARAPSVIRIDYEGQGAMPSPSCDASDCRQVAVWLEGYAITALGGLVPGAVLPLPALRASAARESLQSRSGACRTNQ